MSRARTPISNLYRSHHSATTSSSSSPPDQHATHRTSVSIQPGEDPFSPVRAATFEPSSASASEGDEDEWMRISEDSVGPAEVPEEEEQPEPQYERGGRTVKKRPSFLKDLWDKRLSRSNSVSSLQSLKNKISNPILKTEPPRVGPLRPRASLVSFGEATMTYNASNSVKEEEEERDEPAKDSPQFLSPPNNAYASGTQSLPIKRDARHLSLLGPLENLNQTINPSSLRPLSSHTIAKSASFDSGQLPPTDSPKAFALLVGSKGKEKKNEKKPVEKLTGFRRSFIEGEQKLGKALDTDAPTRFVVPDNRLSLASSSNNTPSLSSSTTTIQSTLHSATATSDTGRRLAPMSEETSRFARDDSMTIPEFLVRSPVTRGFRHNPSSPLPPPTAPLPPLPVDESARRRRISAIRFGTEVKESDKSPNVGSNKLSVPLNLTSRASEPNLRRPLSGLFSGKFRPSSSDKFGSLKRFRSVENLRPVSSATLPKLTSIPATSNSVASLYLVAGLNKDPSKWSLSTSFDSDTSSTPRWRPELLARRETQSGDLTRLGKEETTKAQAQAVKLAFDRNVEIVDSKTQPAATTSFFSFPITTSSSPSSSPLLSPSPLSTPPSRTRSETTFHADVLTVWSRADASRSRAIEKTLSDNKRSYRTTAKSRVANDESDERRDQEYLTESQASTYWLPYNLILVSVSPLFSLLSDVLRFSWARNCHDMALHVRQMQELLDTPLPRVAEKLSFPVDLSNCEGETRFVATVPGDLDLSIPNFPTWPLFEALHSDNILSIVELALAPFGRVLFISQHPVMLSIATFTLQSIVERRGWNGLVRSVTHTRDLHVYLENPGPWILATSSVPVDLSPEIAIVDLDADVVTCSNPPLTALSTGLIRDKARRKLDTALGRAHGEQSSLRSIVEAFPNSKFKPFSEVEVNGERVEAERLTPDPSWNASKLSPSLACYVANRHFSNSGMKSSSSQRSMLSCQKIENEDQSIVWFARANPERRHYWMPALHNRFYGDKYAESFVEGRDTLEAQMSKLDGKVASLASESSRWRDSFLAFKDFSDRLAQEMQSLEISLEKERREAARLSMIIEEERGYQHELETGLEAVEHSRARALADLASTEQARQVLEDRYSTICKELETLFGAGAQSNPLFKAVLESLESLPDSSHSESVNPISTSPEDDEAITVVRDPATSPSPNEFEHFPRSTSSLSFLPKALTLTPPVSPENGQRSPSPSAHPFVTPRTNHRRVVSRQHHSRENSFGSDDSGSFVSFDEAEGGVETHDSGGGGGECCDTILSPLNRFTGIERISEESDPPRPQTDDLASSTTPSPPVKDLASISRPARHVRQDSFSLDAPPIELFTRSRSSGSFRRKGGGGVSSTGARQGSIDLSARMRPSQVKVEGKWEPAPSKSLSFVTE
ncbi:uncharacterized protein JCM6883_004348 [Sporobolomyces salmoneus]|uniref:uncharacterized protein n=1 Tax=Sporobolomyces salmoneus TaxID=183962 RepID=UPI00317159B8